MALAPPASLETTAEDVIVAGPLASRRGPIRLGIVGTGLAVKKLHWPALRRMADRFAVVAFANRTRSTAEEFAALAGLSMAGYAPDYQELLRRDDVQAVLICPPIPALLPVTRDALAAGKHVICEKPPGADLEEARQFLALADRYPDRKILIAENHFYRDDLRLARSLLDGGAVGRPRLLFERWVHRLVPTPGEYSGTPWRYRPAYPGGPLLDGGVHSIATMRLLGGEIARLYARTEWINPTMDAPSVLAMTFSFAGGTSGNCIWGFLGNPVRDEGRDTRLYGSDGTLIVSRGQVRLIRADGASEEYRVEPTDSGHTNMFLNFHDALVHDEPIVGTLGQSVVNMLVVLRALESAERGQPVEASDDGSPPATDGVPLWRPRGASELFEGLSCRVKRIALARE